MEQGQESVPSQPESTEAPAETAAPAPAPAEDPEALKARISELEGEVHQRDVTIGRQGAELGEYRQQVAAAPSAEPEPTPPAGSSYDQFGNLVYSERPGEAFEAFDAHREERTRQVAREEAMAAARQVQERVTFYQDNPHLNERKALVASVVEDMRAKGAFTGDQTADMAEVAKRATAQLTAPTEAAPTPPPVAPATAPPQAPQAPGADAPVVIDHHKAARADAAALKKRQQEQTAVPPLTPE